MKEQIPKTLWCCNTKPKRYGIQTGFKDEINKFVISCRKCGRKIINDNDSYGNYVIELEAVKAWNELISKEDQLCQKNTL